MGICNQSNAPAEWQQLNKPNFYRAEEAKAGFIYDAALQVQLEKQSEREGDLQREGETHRKRGERIKGRERYIEREETHRETETERRIESTAQNCFIA